MQEGYPAHQFDGTSGVSGMQPQMGELPVRKRFMERAPHSETWRGPDGTLFTRLAWLPEGEARTLVLVHHGLGDHAGRYAGLARSLNKLGLQVWAYDARGHGTSSGPRGDAESIDQWVDDFAVMLDDLVERTGADRVVLYGHSTGGLVVARYAQGQPDPKVCAVILSAPVLRPVRSLSVQVKIAVGRTLARIAPRLTLANPAEAHLISRDEGEQERYAQDSLNHDRLSLRFGTSLVDDGEETLQRAARVTLPLLCIHGEEDKVIEMEPTRLFVEGASSVDKAFWGLKDCRHEPHHDAPEAVDALMERINGWVADRLID